MKLNRTIRVAVEAVHTHTHTHTHTLVVLHNNGAKEEVESN